MAVGHSTYDPLYVAFALAVGSARLLVADGPFVAAIARHPDRVGRDAPAAQSMGCGASRLTGSKSPLLPVVEGKLKCSG